MQQTVRQRIIFLREHFGDTQYAFAKRTGFTNPAFIKWEKEGATDPKASSLRQISSHTGCNYTWLSEGTGEMFSPAHAYDDIKGELNEIFTTKPKSSIMSQIKTALDEMKKYQKAAEERSLFIEELLGKSQGNRNASIAA